jgi:hypothetical protein
VKGTKKFLIIMVVVMGIVLGSVGIAYAITFNPQQDGDNHPYVGLALFYDEDGAYMWRCSGSLLSPTVFLTAGHCTDGTASARVLFYSDLTELVYPYETCGPYTCYEGDTYTHPDFCIGCAGGLPGFDTHDVGVVTLDEPVATVSEYAQLPAEGLVDTLKMRTDIDLVGYGVQWKIKDGGVPPSARWTGYRIRYYAPTKLITSKDVISDEYIKLMANPAQGKGGTCFGDSGGPDLLGGTNTVLGVNSFVNSYNCTGVTYSNRVDTGYALEFINSFLGD